MLELGELVGFPLEVPVVERLGRGRGLRQRREARRPHGEQVKDGRGAQGQHGQQPDELLQFFSIVTYFSDGCFRN